MLDNAKLDSLPSHETKNACDQQTVANLWKDTAVAYVRGRSAIADPMSCAKDATEVADILVNQFMLRFKGI